MPGTKITRLERRWTAGVLEAMYPSGEVEGMPGAADVDLIDSYEDYIFRVPRLTALGIRLIMILVTWSPPFFIRRLAPMHRLSSAERQDTLRAFLRSRFYWIREIVLLLKAVTNMGYGSHPRLRGALGIDNAHDSRLVGIDGPRRARAGRP